MRRATQTAPPSTPTPALRRPPPTCRLAADPRAVRRKDQGGLRPRTTSSQRRRDGPADVLASPLSPSGRRSSAVRPRRTAFADARLSRKLYGDGITSLSFRGPPSSAASSRRLERRLLVARERVEDGAVVCVVGRRRCAVQIVGRRRLGFSPYASAEKGSIDSAASGASRGGPSATAASSRRRARARLLARRRLRRRRRRSTAASDLLVAVLVRLLHLLPPRPPRRRLLSAARAAARRPPACPAARRATARARRSCTRDAPSGRPRRRRRRGCGAGGGWRGEWWCVSARARRVAGGGAPAEHGDAVAGVEDGAVDAEAVVDAGVLAELVVGRDQARRGRPRRACFMSAVVNSTASGPQSSPTKPTAWSSASAPSRSSSAVARSRRPSRPCRPSCAATPRPTPRRRSTRRARPRQAEDDGRRQLELRARGRAAEEPRWRARRARRGVVAPWCVLRANDRGRRAARITKVPPSLTCLKTSSFVRTVVRQPNSAARGCAAELLLVLLERLVEERDDHRTRSPPFRARRGTRPGA